MAGASFERALTLIAAANNHGDLAVKLYSLNQAKEILLSAEPALAAELFPFISELQTSPESLVRQSLAEVVEELGVKVMEHSTILVPVLLTLLRDAAAAVVRQSIISGTNFYCSFLEKMAVQFHLSGRVEKWHEELWMLMAKFKESVREIALEPGYVGTKLLAMKFLEKCILLFTPDDNDPVASAKEGEELMFNISWVAQGHPILDPSLLTQEARKSLALLLDQLQSASTLHGSLVVVLINCLAATARRRPLYYNIILSSLLGFVSNFETLGGGHAASIQHSLRTAFLGFLRCTHPSIIESRDSLCRALRAMNAGDAADQAIQQVDKMIKNTEHASHDAQYGKDDQSSSPVPVSLDSKRQPMFHHTGLASNTNEVPGKQTHCGLEGKSFPGRMLDDSMQDDVTVIGIPPGLPFLNSDLTPAEQMSAWICTLLAQGEGGVESLEILLSKISPDLLADIVIENMKHLPKSPPPLVSALRNVPVAPQTSSSSIPSQVASSAPAAPLQATSTIFSEGTGSKSFADVSTVHLPGGYRRDAPRDPRRLDPCRVAVTGSVQPVPLSSKEDTFDKQSDIDS